jgi:hypothetical protein
VNRTLVDRITNAVLYEGYILYPYRPSVKNRQRWTFGGLYPEAHCRAQAGADAWSNQTECLVEGSADTALDVTARFLHLTARVVGEIDPPLAEWLEGTEPPFRAVEALHVGERILQTWQEAEERTVVLAGLVAAELLDRPRRHPFSFPGRRWLEPVRGPSGNIVGVLAREQQTVEGVVEVAAAQVGKGLFRVTVRVVNTTPLAGGGPWDRDAVLLRTLVSTHAVLGVRRGAFVSLLDPPEPYREAAAACRNVGTWPVLVGAEDERDTVLSSPIILYDYPQVAPESPGDLFDGAEIDEILTLRILTLTDDEKRAAAAVDERARALLTRTAGLGPEQLARLHGAIRELRPLPEGHGHD